MFSLAAQRITGRRILVVEAEVELAAAMRNAIAAEGGTPLGPTASIEEALFYIGTVGRVDGVMLDTRMATGSDRMVPDLFRDCRVETIFVTGYDDWFDEDEDDIRELWPAGGLVLATA